MILVPVGDAAAAAAALDTAVAILLRAFWEASPPETEPDAPADGG